MPGRAGGPFSQKKKKNFFLGFILFFSFRLEMEPFAVMLSQLK